MKPNRSNNTPAIEASSEKQRHLTDGVRRHLSVGLLSGLVTVLLSFSPLLELIEMKGYDLFHRFRKASPSEQIVIVAIDEPSFAEIGKQWPWPRSLHGRLIDRLKGEGASVIGLDIMFSEPSAPEEDRKFSEAIKRAGNVVLASDVDVIRDEKFVQETVIEPIPLLSEGATTGIATILLDSDHVVRRFYPLKEGEFFFRNRLPVSSPEEVTGFRKMLTSHLPVPPGVLPPFPITRR